MLNMPKPYNLGHAQCIHKNGETFKDPMLIVGTSNYIREHIGATTQTYDVFLFFYPTSEPVWRIGTLLVDRNKIVEPTGIYVENTCIQSAFKTLFINIFTLNKTTKEFHEVKSLWLQNSIYRCPKISLRDVLELQPYKINEVA